LLFVVWGLMFGIVGEKNVKCKKDECKKVKVTEEM
jgi:hypothetical protein